MGEIKAHKKTNAKGFINGIVIIVENTVWGPFFSGEAALAWAVRNYKDDLYQIKNLMDPDLLDV